MIRPSSNQRAVPVSELTREIRQLLEDGIGSALVEGEVSNLRRQASGHQYFSLKDEFAQLRCVMFRGNARNAPRLEDGMQIQAAGDISVYEAQGQYQLIVRMVQLQGVGSLQARFEALKRQLAGEGLFDEDRKQRIPPFCLTVALVTSPTGAAVRDMLHVLNRRAPWIRVLVYPVQVQGDGAAPQIAEAIRNLSRGEAWGLPRVDAIVVGRGGGSLEDLWAFNEEVVARSIAACPLPVISAVGHEIDFTISDFVADLRAPTPSAAAEILAPDGEELREQFQSLHDRLRNAIQGRVRHWKTMVEMLGRSSAFREPARLLAEHQQSVDWMRDQLEDRVNQRLTSERQRLEALERHLYLSRPDRALSEKRDRVTRLDEHLQSRVHYHLRELKQMTESTGKLLRTLGPDSVFARGFSMTTDGEGNVLSSVREVKPGARVRTRLSDGEFDSTVDEQK